MSAARKLEPGQRRERGIMFKDEMVRAILAGTKHQTRRVIKPEWYRCLDLDSEEDREKARPWCPYGRPGDALWARECWYANSPGSAVLYRADHPEPEAKEGPWKPSLLMPRWASRITLPLVEVRVERLQDITEEDSKAEGVELPACTYVGECRSNSCPRHGRLDRHRNAFARLWDSINGEKPGCPWADSPWVWCLTWSAPEVRR